MITKDFLKEIILSQKETMDRLDTGSKREKEKDVKIVDSFALLITGVRRCGKSTFLNQLRKKNKGGYYLNFEDPRLEGFELQDFDRLETVFKKLFGGEQVYFFDEIQNIPKWEKFIRYLLDKKDKVVITGSNASLLSKELGTKLTGRHLQMEMFPFSFKEVMDINHLKPSLSSFERYLYEGGFPEFLKKKNPEILFELQSDIILKDIAVRFGIKNTHFLNKIATFLISNAGKEFSCNSIKKTFGIKSVQSVVNYISYLEDTYLIFTIPKFSYSYKKQQVNPKKAYVIDNGLACNNSVSFSKDKGRILENIVFLGLRRKFKDIFYFQEKGECDFLVRQKEKIIHAIQVCFDFNKENKQRELDGLLEALNKFKLNKGFILTYNQEDELTIEGKTIIIKPVWEWLLE